MKKRQANKLIKRRYDGSLVYNDPQLQKAITVYVRFKRREPKKRLFYEAYIVDELREFFEKIQNTQEKGGEE